MSAIEIKTHKYVIIFTALEDNFVDVSLGSENDISAVADNYILVTDILVVAGTILLRDARKGAVYPFGFLDGSNGYSLSVALPEVSALGTLRYADGVAEFLEAEIVGLSEKYDLEALASQSAFIDDGLLCDFFDDPTNIREDLLSMYINFQNTFDVCKLCIGMMPVYLIKFDGTQAKVDLPCYEKDVATNEFATALLAFIGLGYGISTDKSTIDFTASTLDLSRLNDVNKINRTKGALPC